MRARTAAGALLGALLIGASASATVIKGGGSPSSWMPPFAPASAAQLELIRSFTAAHAGLTSKIPSLSGSESQLRVLGAMTARLPADFDSRLATALQSPEENAGELAALSEELAAAYQAAVPEADAALRSRVGQLAKDFLAGDIGAQDLAREAADLKQFAFYGPDARAKVEALEDIVNAARAEKTIALAQELAARLAGGQALVEIDAQVEVKAPALERPRPKAFDFDRYMESLAKEPVNEDGTGLTLEKYFSKVVPLYYSGAFVLGEERVSSMIGVTGGWAGPNGKTGSWGDPFKRLLLGARARFFKRKQEQPHDDRKALPAPGSSGALARFFAGVRGLLTSSRPAAEEEPRYATSSREVLDYQKVVAIDPQTDALIFRTDPKKFGFLERVKRFKAEVGALAGELSAAQAAELYFKVAEELRSTPFYISKKAMIGLYSIKSPVFEDLFAMFPGVEVRALIAERILDRLAEGRISLDEFRKYPGWVFLAAPEVLADERARGAWEKAAAVQPALLSPNAPVLLAATQQVKNRSFQWLEDAWISPRHEGVGSVDEWIARILLTDDWDSGLVEALADPKTKPMLLADPRVGALVKFSLSKRDHLTAHHRVEHYWMLWMVLARDKDWPSHPDSIDFLKLVLRHEIERTSEAGEAVTREDLDRHCATISSDETWRRVFMERGYEVRSGAGALELVKALGDGRARPLIGR